MFIGPQKKETLLDSSKTEGKGQRSEEKKRKKQYNNGTLVVFMFAPFEHVCAAYRDTDICETCKHRAKVSPSGLSDD